VRNDARWRGLACGVAFTWPAMVFAQSAELSAASGAQNDPTANSPVLRASDDPAVQAHSDLQLSMFVDAYAAWQTGGKGTLATLSGHRAFSGQGSTSRAENGFSLAFLGFDAQYDTGSFGAVANLRFGPAASIFHRQAQAESDFSFGIDHLTQAYVLYRPVQQLELDLGMFMSPFGAESLESWKNLNYTISALYVYGQPSWHAGLKASWELEGGITLLGVVVNGTNNISETQQNGGLDQSPTIGGSVSYEASPALSFALGGLYAIHGDDNDDSGVDAFVDLVSTVRLGALTGSLNGDFICTRDGAPSGGDRFFWGGSVTVGYRVNEVVGVAGRAEYLHDDANYGDSDIWKLVTGTLTLDVHPLAGVPHLILRWDNRWERSNQSVFGKDSRGTADTADDTYGRTWFETVLGVVVTTAP
jgi:Putative beta-barrel porin-2, OmpL-like. bbp2